MSVGHDLDKAKKYVAGANFVSALIMIVTFFILQNLYPSADNYWVLVAGIVFALAGILFIAFIRRLRKRFDKSDVN